MPYGFIRQQFTNLYCLAVLMLIITPLSILSDFLHILTNECIPIVILSMLKLLIVTFYYFLSQWCHIYAMTFPVVHLCTTIEKVIV